MAPQAGTAGSHRPALANATGRRVTFILPPED